MGGSRGGGGKTTKATNGFPPSPKRERGRGQRDEEERKEINKGRNVREEEEEEVEGGGRGLGGVWPSYTAQYDTHFSSLHTYSHDQGTGIF